ncbi:hypothetical protein [Maribellus sp. YY47]|uniref:hypothetical protein n=1 Tax=Maribellus sp. YY47 TaxID=2929486 RepID=UPI00200162F7|nr:hypothetical protein [Maribellus sp. YY47]MCK3684795.1 hypothetical protein [Maribellus sp. YY47]
MANLNQSDNNSSKWKFNVPRLLRRKRKKRDKFLEAFEEWNNLSSGEQEERRQLADLIERNSFKWYKVSPDTKATIRANGLLSILLIVITSITVIQQCSTNNLQKESIHVMLKQDSTNQQNLKLLQKEFDLNYRPFLNIVAFAMSSDTTVYFGVNNYGKLPAYYVIKSIRFISDKAKKISNINVDTSGSIIYPTTEKTPFLVYIDKDLSKQFYFNNDWICEIVIEYNSLHAKNDELTYYYKHTLYVQKSINSKESFFFPIKSIDAN